MQLEEWNWSGQSLVASNWLELNRFAAPGSHSLLVWSRYLHCFPGCPGHSNAELYRADCSPDSARRDGVPDRSEGLRTPAIKRTTYVYGTSRGVRSREIGGQANSRLPVHDRVWLLRCRSFRLSW